MVRVTFDPKNPPPLTAAEREQLARLDEQSEDEIDTSDLPEITDEVWSRVIRGAKNPTEYYRALKQSVTIRLDKDVVAWFKANAERGYQTEINRVLRQYVIRAATAQAVGHPQKRGTKRRRTG